MIVAAHSPLQLRTGSELLLRRRRSTAGLGTNLRDFAIEVNPRYQWFRHCEILADALEKVASGEIRRLMAFMPPRHGKSELVSRIFPAYFLRKHPDRWVGINSYNAELAYTFSRAARANYLRDGRNLKDDAAAVKHWETGKGGGLWATGVGGPATGKGLHLGVIDDPLKNHEEAASSTIRQKQKDWYQSTFYTRLEPDGAIVLCMTRWNEDDLAGWLLNADEQEEIEPWHIISLPAIYDGPVDGDFPRECTVEPDWREEGEALCPERFPAERLEKIEAAVGDQQYISLYGQKPGTAVGKGRVYFNFRTRNVAEVSDPGGDVLVGMDFNVAPMSAVAGAKVVNELHIYDEITLDDSGTPEMIEELNLRYPKRRIVVYPDPSGNSRKTSAKVGETDFTLLRATGFIVIAPPSAPAVVDRVNEVNVLCGAEKFPPRLFVDPRKCRKLKRALERLGYKPDTGQIDKGKGLDHITDALGYLVHGVFPVSGVKSGSGKRPF